MKSDVINIADNVVKMYVKRYPQQVDFKIYRGDRWSFTFIGLNGDDTPFDWSIADSMAMNFRAYHPLNPAVAVDLTIDHFVFDKSPTSPVYDKLMLEDIFGNVFKGLLSTTFYYDLQLTIGGDPITPVRGIVSLEFDVTRFTQGLFTWDSNSITFDNNTITWDRN